MFHVFASVSCLSRQKKFRWLVILWICPANVVLCGRGGGGGGGLGNLKSVVLLVVCLVEALAGLHNTMLGPQVWQCGRKSIWLIRVVVCIMQLLVAVDIVHTTPVSPVKTLTPTNIWLCLQSEWIQLVFTPRSNDSAVDMGFNQLRLWLAVMETCHLSESTNLAVHQGERAVLVCSNLMHQGEKH